jgi:hypothetical protein
MATPKSNRSLSPKLLVSALRTTVSSPLFTGPLLFGLLYYPRRMRSVLPPGLARIVYSKGFIQTLKVLLFIGVLKATNRFLSQRALNNAVEDSTWDWKKEIVLVTGGSSGIGEIVTRKLAERGIKVIVLDIIPPKEELRKFLYLPLEEIGESGGVLN